MELNPIMKPYFPPAEHPPEQRIRDLESELYHARETLFRLAGKTAEQILQPYGKPTERSAHQWYMDMVERAIELATPASSEERRDNLYSGDRACCPLCGGSTSFNAYQPNYGFAYPDGLRQHLLGLGRARHCAVAREALAHAMAKTRLRAENAQ